MTIKRVDPQRSLLENLRLYGAFIAIAVRARMQYRSDFIFGILSVFVLNGVNLSLIWVMLARFQNLAGWGFWEVVMLYATFLLSHSFFAVFFWHIYNLEDMIIQGRFDQYLIRPCSPMLQFLGSEVNYMGAGDIIFASTAFALAYRELGLAWGLDKWAFFVVIILAGLIIETCLTWILGALSFWYGRTRAVSRIASNFQYLVQQYPLDMFGIWFRVFVTGFLPFAFMNYYPLTILLDKENVLNAPILGWISPLVAILLLLASLQVWKRGIRGYSSSGS